MAGLVLAQKKQLFGQTNQLICLQRASVEPLGKMMLIHCTSACCRVVRCGPIVQLTCMARLHARYLLFVVLLVHFKKGIRRNAQFRYSLQTLEYLNKFSYRVNSSWTNTL